MQGNASSQSIRAYELNKLDGSLKLLAQYSSDYAGKNSIYMTTTKNGNYLYAVNSLIGQNEESNIVSFKIDKNNNGQLIRINSVVGTGGQNAVHISLDGNEDFLYISHYDNGGALSVYRRNKNDGSIGERVFLNIFPNSGGNLHSSYSLANKYVYAPDLGRNKILNYVSDSETGNCSINENQSDGFVTKSGPRHMAFHSNGLYAYIVHEFSNDISILSINGATGSLDLIEDKISTLAPGVVQSNGQSAGAIRISDDQQFLYVSNRVIINSMTAYRILANGSRLNFIGTYETLGLVPRDFYIIKEYLIVANQNTASVVTFKINLDGTLTKLNGPMFAELPLAVAAVEI